MNQETLKLNQGETQGETQGEDPCGIDFKDQLKINNLSNNLSNNLGDAWLFSKQMELENGSFTEGANRYHQVMPR